MNNITFKITMDNIEQIKQLSDESIARALEQCGALWESYAKQEAPVDTGRLRNSIEHHAEGVNRMIVSTDVEYAIYQEMGTRYQSGTPFMRPAGESHIAEYANIIMQALK